MNSIRYEKYSHSSQEELDNALLHACATGDIEMVKYILTSPELPLHADIHSKGGDYDCAFRSACEHGYLPIVRYLLTSNELDEHVNIQSNSLAFIRACQYGHMDIVQYLLTSSELQEHVDIAQIGSKALLNACQNKHFDIFRYLLSSTELSCHASLRELKERVFQILIEQDSAEVLEFLFNDVKELSIDIFEEEDYNFACQYHKFNVLAFLLPLSAFNIQQSPYPFDWFIANAGSNTTLISSALKAIQQSNYIEYIECLSFLENVWTNDNHREQYNHVKTMLEMENANVSTELPLIL